MPCQVPRDMIVVRGGIIPDLDALVEQAEDEFAESGMYGLSTFCAIKEPDETLDDVLLRICREAQIPNGQIRVTTAGELMDRQFHIFQTGEPPCHHDVDLGGAATRDIVARFEQAFDGPRRNPCR